MKNHFYLFLSLICLTSIACEDYNERLVPLIGVYDGQVVGVSNLFSFSVSLDAGDDVLIDAPFDGLNYTVLDVRVNRQEEEIMELEFCDQALDSNAFICGSGIYSFGTLQLDYEIDNGLFVETFTLVATKF